jgi:cytokinesis protein
MGRAGLTRIMGKVRQFEVAQIDTQLDTFESNAEEDRAQLVKGYNEELLRDINDPYDVYRALMSNVEGTTAAPYLLSAMQHLLLIKEDTELRTRYFQLIDHLITSVVMDKKQGFSEGLSNTVGVSVARLVAQFGEQDRAQKAEDELATVRAQLSRTQLEKEALEEEISRGEQGLVGQLRGKVVVLEEKLRQSRSNNEALEAKLGDQKRQYEDAIEQLEAQILELFRMIRDVNPFDFEKLKELNSGDMKGGELLTVMKRQLDRDKTFSILEGNRTPRKGRRSERGSTLPEVAEDEADGENTTPQAKRAVNGRVAGPRATADGTPTGPEERASQFMDADEEHEQMQQNSASGQDLLVRTSAAH